MPTSYQLTPQALDDLSEIWDYIAEDNLRAANRVESAILSGLLQPRNAPPAWFQTKRDYSATGSILDDNSVSQLRSGLPSRHEAASSRVGPPCEAEHRGFARGTKDLVMLCGRLIKSTILSPIRSNSV